MCVMAVLELDQPVVDWTRTWIEYAVAGASPLNVTSFCVAIRLVLDLKTELLPAAGLIETSMLFSSVLEHVFPVVAATHGRL
jgi:hypothetical protein